MFRAHFRREDTQHLTAPLCSEFDMLDVSHIVEKIRAINKTEDNCELEAEFVHNHVVGIVSYDANAEKEEWDTHFLLRFEENEGYGEDTYKGDLSDYRALSRCLMGKFDELVLSGRTPGERRHGDDCPLQILDMMRILSTASLEEVDLAGEMTYLGHDDSLLEESCAFVSINVVVIEKVQEFELLIDRRSAEVYLVP